MRAPGCLDLSLRNKWCNYTHLGQCSFAGVYQPSLPDAGTAYGHFFLIGLCAVYLSPTFFCFFFSYLIFFIKSRAVFGSFQGGYLKVWEFLGIGAHASLRDVAKAGKEVCALDAIEVGFTAKKFWLVTAGPSVEFKLGSKAYF